MHEQAHGGDGNDIVVVGGSAGALEALQTVVGGLRSDLPAAIFVVLHVPAHATSQLATILRRCTRLPVVQPEDRDVFDRGRIYVAQPDHHLLVEQERVRVVRGPQENRHRPAIDPLFRSAAWAHGPRVVSVLLSGLLDDGTAGSWAVKTCGGVTIAQDPERAPFPDMPRNAIEAATIDHVVEPAKIGKLLATLVRTRRSRPRVAPPASLAIENQIVKMESNDIEHVAKLGTRAALACPRCHGALWELDDGSSLRYRCHIGHTFGAQSLVAEQSDEVDAALESALRALEENAAASRRIATMLHERGSDLAESYASRSDEQERKAGILRRIVRSDG